MNSSTTTIKLIPNNDTAKRFIAIMGDTVVRTDECWEDDDPMYAYADYEFIGRDEGGPSVAWCGDDSIGACVGAYMKGENIIGIFNFGDEGNYERVIDDKESFFVISDL